MGSQIFPVPVGLTTAVLCANLLSPQVLEGYWEVYQKVTMELLEDLILNNKDLLRIKKVFIYI